MCVSADGSRLFSGSDDNTIKVWDVATGACLQTLEGHADAVYSVCVSADGSRLFSGSDDNTIKVWDVATGACLQTLEGHADAVYSVCVSADGSRLFSGSGDKTIKVSGKIQLSYQSARSRATVLGFRRSKRDFGGLSAQRGCTIRPKNQ